MVSADLSTIDEPDRIAPVTLGRIGKALDLLDIRFLADGSGSLLAMWERHAVLFTLEGPDDEILVMRPGRTPRSRRTGRIGRTAWSTSGTTPAASARPTSATPPSGGSCRSTPRCRCRSTPGAHDALLVEMLDCGAAVATSFVDWLHDEGALLDGSASLRGDRLDNR